MNGTNLLLPMKCFNTIDGFIVDCISTVFRYDWGPLWSYSKFIFKSSNTSLLDLCNVMLGVSICYVMQDFAVYGSPPVLVGKYPDGF